MTLLPLKIKDEAMSHNCEQSLEVGKGNATDSLFKPPAGTQFCLLLGFSPMSSILDFWFPEL